MKKRKRRKTEYCKPALLLLTLVLLLCGCGSGQAVVSLPGKEKNYSGMYEEAKAAAQNRSGAVTDYGVSAPGTETEENDKVVVDFSPRDSGYICVKKKPGADKGMRLQINANGDTVTYFLSGEEWEFFPLSFDNGEYRATVFENVEGSKYAMILTCIFEVDLKEEFAPYLLPNQYVNYIDAPVTVELAGMLTGADEMETVTNVFNYVTSSLDYDVALAETVSQEYVPHLDAVLEKGSGICFDYASLMAAMLRCSGIPCRLVTGYVGTVYHAWISVWSETEGWIEAVIYFDGKGWQRMDPTFADSSGSRKDIAKFIGDGSNYSEKYYY